MIKAFSGGDHETGVAQPKRKRKRRRSPGGLGRGLARILTDSQAPSEVVQPSRSGLLQLVGGHSNAKTDRIRRFVVDTALSALVDGFGLDGLVLAAQGPVPSGPSAHQESPAQQLSLLPAAPRSDHAEGGDCGRPQEDGGPAGGNQPAGQEVQWPTGEGAPTFLAARLPPSWAAESQVLFEVYGNLWKVLQHEGFGSGDLDGPDGLEAGTLEQYQVPLGRHRVLLTRLDDDGLPVAAAAIREAPFTPAEAEALRTVIGSIVAACSDSDSKAAARHEIRTGTTATLKLVSKSAGTSAGQSARSGPAGGDKPGDNDADNSPDDTTDKAADKTGPGTAAGGELVAEVNADWELQSGRDAVRIGGRRSGVARGSDPVTAMARAAAKACRPRCEIAFAGASELEDVSVSIVMIRHPRHGLRLGYAVRPRGDHSGAAEAVFTAAG